VIKKRSVAHSLYAIKALTRRDFFSMLNGWGLYSAATISFLASSFLANNYLKAIWSNNYQISSDPLISPLFISIIVVSFYLAIISASSISRERDHGTLEVLFYGPVDSVSFLVAKYIKDILVYLVIVVFFFIYFTVVFKITRIDFSWQLMKTIFYSILLVSCVISFSLFISSLTSKMRTSIILLIGILVAFLVIQLFHSMLLNMDEENLSTSIIFLRKGLGIISQVTRWISPFAGFMSSKKFMGIGTIQPYGMGVLYSIVYSFIFLFLSVQILERKGVRG